MLLSSSSNLQAENVMIECLPDSEFSKMVKLWGEWDPVKNKGEDVPFAPMTAVELQAMIRMITNPVQSDGSRKGSVQVKEGGPTVEMRENNFKTVQAFCGAVRMIHAQGGVTSPTEDLDVVKILKDLAKDYLADGVKSVDPVSFLPAMHRTVWLTDLYKSEFERLYTWTLILVMWNLLARPCEVCSAFALYSELYSGVQKSLEFVPRSTKVP